MSAYRAARATEETFTLAEGPVWDARRDGVLWVDILDGAVLAGRLNDTGLITVVDRWDFDGPVGAVLPTASGGLAVVERDRVVLLSSDGHRTAGPRFVLEGAPSRSNDAAVGPDGRLLIGTHPYGDGAAHSAERLVQVAGDEVRVLDDDLRLSNGLAWSPDGGTLYSIDTLASTVWAREYDPLTGATGDRRIHLGPESMRGGMPDGMCADTEGGLWIAFWGEGAVRRFGADRAETDTVHVPATNTSSVAFAGPALDVLVITTAREGLDERQLRDAPASGALFTVCVNARGLPQPAYRFA